MSVSVSVAIVPVSGISITMMSIESAVVVPWISFCVSLRLSCWFSAPLLTSVIAVGIWSIVSISISMAISITKVAIAIAASIKSAIVVVRIGVSIGSGLSVGRPLG